MARVGVQTGLSDVEQELQTMGHDVVQVQMKKMHKGVIAVLFLVVIQKWLA
ncbi:hypothetical protein JCM19046_983 [Bacillus sp. JCM 19046]|nr:hypothetical protein JCM19045_3993 [Bacillus sp. JCM 19045]GAF16539.1 hypothetical protein JCM19046_983 [Bacillus sp. JCM 19046]